MIGRFRVSGRWHHSPGSWHADWAVLGFPISDASGEIVDHGFALIARDDLKLEETWFVAGMKSSGSNCLIASNVYVPDHRILSMTGAIYGDYRSEHTDVPLYRSALIPVLALALAGPQLGLGRRALQLVKEHAAHKPVSYTYYSAQSDSVAFQLQIAEAAMLIDTAHLHAQRAAEDIDSAARRGVYPDELGRARVRADAGWARAAADYARLTEEFPRTDAAVANASLDDTFSHDGEVMSLRLIYLHMIEEYARHLGHADLLREQIDGATGE